MHDPDRFRSLASIVRGADETPTCLDACEAALPAQPRLATAEFSELSRDVRLFRVRIAALVEEAVQTLVSDIAASVLARELQLAPIDVQVIANAALQRYVDEEPLRIRAHPRDAERLQCAVPVLPDAGLLPGDIVLELRTGSIDATLGARLADLLESMG